jgi:hypothetical protein
VTEETVPTTRVHPSFLRRIRAPGRSRTEDGEGVRSDML